ncbi:TetR/AcrR family transcriptional regulator [Streptomyces longispororuber]|uniref:TetR/AcrR family transcriptional regulator n=1 Tax=Streptomyces longispororuber TaxID=68230 RepID=UPI00210E621D|nr:TetR/AcrR family transcriptional regulator [Streptomyces longispororuber]MCQ4211702.1 TetR/AcrR family transcriptional regulator [Streptomyces longispororuber]
MEPVLSEPAGPSGPPSVLELAFSDAAADSPDMDDEVSVRLLDAAYEQFCRMGIKRSTMADVAKLAGVSRITVYRRFATKEALVEQVVRREFRRYFDQFTVEVQAAGTVADRVVVGFVSSLRAIRHNRLIGGLMTVEPEVVVPSMTGDGGRTLFVVQQFVAERLRQEQRAGHVGADVDVDVVAEMMVRVCTSFLVVPSHVIDLDDDERMRAVARQFLVPMLGPPCADPRHA